MTVRHGDDLDFVIELPIHHEVREPAQAAAPRADQVFRPTPRVRLNSSTNDKLRTAWLSLYRDHGGYPRLSGFS